MNMILFSGDYDKALAALILANSAMELGMDVSIFFGFWGLFLLRDPEKMAAQDKTNYEKIFAMVTPKGPEDLPLSRMNFSGLGKVLLKTMMKDDDAPPLEAFLKGARKKGVKFYGCKLSMDVMGFKKDELIPEVEVVDAKGYLKDAIESNIQLFIWAGDRGQFETAEKVPFLIRQPSKNVVLSA